HLPKLATADNLGSCSCVDLSLRSPVFQSSTTPSLQYSPAPVLPSSTSPSDETDNAPASAEYCPRACKSVLSICPRGQAFPGLCANPRRDSRDESQTSAATCAG